VLNLKYAPAILTIVQEGSITAASKKLFVSQPALSQTIRQVEEELGAPIFTRDTRHIELTYVGKLYIESVRQIQMIDQNLHARVSDSKGEVFGTFRLGISVQRGLQLLPLVIPEFIARYPLVRIQLREEGSGMLERRVLEGQCDLGFVTTASKRDQLTYALIENEQLMLVAATTTELARRFPDGTPIDIAEAQHENFVSMTEGHSVRAIQDKLFEKYGLSPQILLETHNMEAAKRIAARANAVFLVPSAYVSDTIEDRELMHIYPIVNAEFAHHFYVCFRKGKHLPRYELDFIQLVCSVLGAESPLTGQDDST
jgi:DNA-binding transcriptional LysR family regulator